MKHNWRGKLGPTTNDGRTVTRSMLFSRANSHAAFSANIFANAYHNLGILPQKENNLISTNIHRGWVRVQLRGCLVAYSYNCTIVITAYKFDVCLIYLTATAIIKTIGRGPTVAVETTPKLAVVLTVTVGENNFK